MNIHELHELATVTLAEVIRHEDNGGTFAVKVRTRDVRALCTGVINLIKDPRSLQEEGGLK